MKIYRLSSEDKDVGRGGTVHTVKKTVAVLDLKTSVYTIRGNEKHTSRLSITEQKLTQEGSANGFIFFINIS